MLCCLAGGRGLTKGGACGICSDEGRAGWEMGGWIGESVVGGLGGCGFCWRTTIDLGERVAAGALVGREGAVFVAA